MIENEKDTVRIDASKSRVIGADGVNSMVRNRLVKASEITGFTDVKVTPWTYEFRVLFGKAVRNIVEIS